MVRDKLTPRYAVGCKRPGFHNTYLSTFNRDNVDLVTDPIEKITPAGIATVEGDLHEVDVLILATGFKVMDVDSLTYDITGRGGQSLSRFWEENRLQAYEGVSLPGFPNFFTVCRPYGFVGSSFFALIETQTHHIVRCLERAERQGATRVEVTEAGKRAILRRMHAQAPHADLLAGQLQTGQQLLLRLARRRAAAPGHNVRDDMAEPPIPPR
jgi:cyclohexanone monooxygenase